MAYQSIHSGPTVDASVGALAEIESVRDTVVATGSQVAADASTASSAASTATTQAGIATGAASDAQNSAGAAELSATASADSADNSAAARDAAEEARNLSEQHKDGAEAARDAAAGSAAEAASSETQAALEAATVDYHVDQLQAALRFARYGADAPYPEMDNLFSGAAMLDPRLTFTRPGAGTVWGPAGQLITVGVDEPRFAYDPLTGMAQGLLIEPQATNLVLHSQEYTDSSWSVASGLSVREALSPAPNGVAEAFTLESESAGYFNQTFLPDAEGKSFVGGLFIRKTTNATVFPMLGLVFQGGVTLISFVFLNTNTGEAIPRNVNTAFDGCIVYDYGDFWRVLVAGHSGENHSARIRIYPAGNYGGDVYVSGLYNTVTVWGFHATEGSSFLGSYIPTSGSSVTRPADTLACDMQAVTGFSGTRGGFVLDWTDLTSDGTPLMLTADDVAPESADHIAVTRDGNKIRLSVSVNDVVEHTTVDTPEEIQTNTPAKLAFRYVGNSVALSVNGNPVRTLTHSESPPQGLRYLFIGRDCNGYYRRAPWYPFPLTDAQLQTLSAGA